MLPHPNIDDSDLLCRKSEKSTTSRGKGNGKPVNNTVAASRKRKSTALVLSSDEEEESLPRKKAAVANENGGNLKSVNSTKPQPKPRSAFVVSDDSSGVERPPKKSAKREPVARKSEPKAKLKATFIETSDDEPAPKKASTQKAPPTTKVEPKSKSKPKKDTESEGPKPAKPKYERLFPPMAHTNSEQLCGNHGEAVCRSCRSRLKGNSSRTAELPSGTNVCVYGRIGQSFTRGGERSGETLRRVRKVLYIIDYAENA